MFLSPSPRTPLSRSGYLLAALGFVIAGVSSLFAAGSAADGFQPEPNGIVYAQAVQADGKILLGGNFTAVRPNQAGAEIARRRLVRLNPDGSLDTTFPDPGLSGTVYAILVQADNRILVAGDFTTVQPNGGPTVPRGRIARFNADGTLDATFNPTASSSVRSLAVQPDGRILIGGYFTSLQPNGAASPTTRNRIARLNADGTLDTTFDPNANQAVFSIAVQGDNRILIGGNFTTLQPNGAATATNRSRLARLNANGTVDPIFNPSPNDRVRDIRLQADGKILIGGNFTSLTAGGGGTAIGYGYAIRLNADGTVDSSFYPRASGEVFAVRRQPDGRILIAGNFGSIQPGSESSLAASYVARVNADGTADRTFIPGPNSTVYALELLPDGGILLGGSFSQIRNNNQSSTVASRNNFARVNSQGTIDRDFEVNSVGRIVSLTSYSDGRLILGGNFTSIGGRTRNFIARTLSDGTVDPAFAPKLDGPVVGAAIQSDGKIVIVGSFIRVNDEEQAYIARLNADGSLDASFAPLPSASALSVAIQADGKILVGGNFTRFLIEKGKIDTTVRNFVARLNTDGTVDSTFDANTNSPVHRFNIISPNRILITGEFTGLNFNDVRGDVDRDFIAMIDGTGQVDVNFEIKLASQISDAVVQSDGKVVIVGNFTGIREPLQPVFTVRNYIARLNANGTIDTTFDPSANFPIGKVAIQADDKILVGGGFTTIGGTTRVNFARLNTDGTVDTAYNPNPEGRQGTQINAISVQADGKAIISGSFSTLQPNATGPLVERVHVARLNTDGTVDATFNPNATGAAGIAVNALAQQPDGGMIVGGDFADFGGANSSHLARFRTDGVADSGFRPEPNGPVRAISVRPGINAVYSQINNFAVLQPDGTLDTTFDPMGAVQVNGPTYASAVQTDGKVLVGGFLGSLTGEFGRNLLRFNADGSFDAAFRPSFNNYVGAIVPLADGRILAAGGFTAIEGIGHPSIARLNADGTYDDTFHNLKANGEIVALKQLGDGKLLVAGSFTQLTEDSSGTLASRGRFARLNADGTLDTVFWSSADAAVNAILVQSDGKIVIGGAFHNVKPTGSTELTVRNFLARFNADGTLDTGFDPGATDSNSFSEVYSLAQQADGKILVGGSFPTIGGVVRSNLARLNEDGTLDTTFNPSPNNAVNHVVVDGNNKILVGGNFTEIDGVTRNHLARLNEDGSVDFSFNANVLGVVNSVFLPGDGRIFVQGEFAQLQPGDAIMIGGAFDEVAGNPASNFAVLNADGTISGGFQPDPDGPVNAILTEPDGRIVLGGAFANVTGGARAGLARFDAAGVLEPGFVADVVGEVFTVAQQADGRLLVGGAFSSIGGQARTNLARLNSDGSVDGGYTPNPDGAVYAIGLETDGSAVVGGDFANIGGAARARIARIQANGAAAAFSPGANGLVRSVAVRADGKVAVGGDFTQIGGVARNRLALLAYDGTVDANFDANADGSVRTLLPMEDGRLLVGGAFANIGGRARVALARVSTSEQGYGTITVDEALSTVAWNRFGAVTGLSSVRIEFSSDSRLWLELGAATRVPGTENWELTGQSLPADQAFFIRAVGRTGTSQYASEGLVQQVWQFLGRPIISSASTADAVVGDSFYYAISTVRPASLYEATGLPAGLTINANTGIISGQPLAAGIYVITLRVTDGTGPGVRTLTLDVAGSAPPSSPAGRIVALATLGFVTTDDPLIGGFAISGSSPKSLMIRGLGPTLSSLGVTDPLEAPLLHIYDVNGNLVATGTSWGGDPELADNFARLGLFPLDPDSTDAAIMLTLAPGLYTAQLLRTTSPASGTGLLELYDANDTDYVGAPRVNAISTRGVIDSQGHGVIGGLAVYGSDPVQVLIRGVGPYLSDSSQLTEEAAIDDPYLRVYNAAQEIIAENDNWETQTTANASYPPGTPAEISAAAATVGLGAYTAGSLDSALLLTLSPGTYTMRVSVPPGSTAFSSGTGLVEIYEVP